jgi:hypothetical protein
MLYIITDIFLKVALNTNKTGHLVIRYTCNWHIIEGGAKTPIKEVTMLYLMPDTVESGIKYQ